MIGPPLPTTERLVTISLLSAHLLVPLYVATVLLTVAAIAGMRRRWRAFGITVVRRSRGGVAPRSGSSATCSTSSTCADLGRPPLGRAAMVAVGPAVVALVSRTRGPPRASRSPVIDASWWPVRQRLAINRDGGELPDRGARSRHLGPPGRSRSRSPRPGHAVGPTPASAVDLAAARPTMPPRGRVRHRPPSRRPCRTSTPRDRPRLPAARRPRRSAPPYPSW